VSSDGRGGTHRLGGGPQQVQLTWSAREQKELEQDSVVALTE
jgi:hypothetical protein